MAKDKKTGNQYISEKQGKAKAARDAHKDQQIYDREARKVDQSKRTPQQQLNLLDKRIGVGIGASKERAKLHRLRLASISKTEE